jgi:hypothetical protein
MKASSAVLPRWGVDALESDEYEFASPWSGELYGELYMESPFSEAEEMELASQLFEITSEEELDQFIGKLLKKAWRGIKKVGGKIIRPIGNVLRGVAKAALPFVGGALGSFIPIPGVGTALGTALGGAVSKALELEFEGLDQEDQEFEMARSFVRLAGTAAKQAAVTPPGPNPTATAQRLVLAAARQHIPGLDGQMMDKSPATSQVRRGQRSGQWIRRGGTIIVLGA